MNKDKRTQYIVSFSILAFLLAAFFVNFGNSKILAACLLIPLTAVTCILIQRRRAFSINKKEVLLLALVVGVLYVILYQMTGLFFTFYKNPYFVNTKTFFTTVLPIALIIVTTEIIRSGILVQNNKITSVLAFASCVVAEALTYANLSEITSLNRFMDLIGLTLFPAVTANVYYHYVSKRYGMFPNIVFRLLTTLYIYFIPMTTDISDSLTACIKIILPLGMLALTAAMFEKKKKNAVRHGKKIGKVGTVLTVIFVVAVAMLISCQFRFGALVIATDSMTGELNRGDTAIFEQYDDQAITVGQVIVFEKDDSLIVHRVVDIHYINGETQYYTKGDINEDRDTGHITEGDIVGIVHMKIPYAGYPTLWIRSLFSQ